jgi:uncharacterized protein YjcR
MPKKRQSAVAHLEFHKLLQEGTIKRRRRMAETMKAGVMMNEKQALLMFPVQRVHDQALIGIYLV